MISWKNILSASLLAVTLLAPACAGGDKDNRKLVWSDEFNYEGLPDDTKWNYDTIGNSYGWGNNELQFYTVARKKNAYVDGKNLVLTAINENWNDYKYTSARLTTNTKGDWKYGRMEIRASIPGGRGAWPAIWMLPTDWEYGGWPQSGEIDIMEHVGYEPDSIYTTVHTGAFNHTIGTQVGKATYVSDGENVFHVYAIEWNADKIDFFIDREKVFTFNNSKAGSDEWPFDERFHLILNVAIGGDWGGLHGVDESIFPIKMKVDYVRIYQ